MHDEERLSLLENRIDYHFRNKELLRQALTHSSYANERRINHIPCNERLEFLGDAVLELISSHFIYLRYPDLPEGKLSRLRASLVCETALALCAARIGLGELLFLGKGEEAGGGRSKPSVTSDAYEALIGAIYLDSDMSEAKRFVEREVLQDTESHIREKDAKTELQEWLQKNGDVKIEYILMQESGPDHDKTFTIEVRVNGRTYGQGSGRNKKNAEKAAAAAALEYCKKERQ